MNGKKLRELREARGMTRRQVSIITGVTEETIRNLETEETANPTLKTIKALAEAYEVEIEDIIGEED